MVSGNYSWPTGLYGCNCNRKTPYLFYGSYVGPCAFVSSIGVNLCAFIVILHDSLRSSPCCPKLHSHSFECIFHLFSNHPCDNRMAGPSTPSSTQPREKSPFPGFQHTVTCLGCSKEGHYESRCPEKQHTQCVCFSCGLVGHYAHQCELRKLKRTMAEAAVCRRCGEKGHYSNQCTNCPNCDEDHPPGSCPITKVTCFPCEGHDHCPKECHLHRMITQSVELQRRILRADVSNNFHPNVTCYHCGRTGHYANWCLAKALGMPRVYPTPTSAPVRPSPPVAQRYNGGKNSQNSGAFKPNITCFHCGRQGHYASHCLAKQRGMPRTYQAPTSLPAPTRPSPPSRTAPTAPQVNLVTAKEANDAPDIVLGTLLVNSAPTTVLFGSVAYQSFFLKSFAALNLFNMHTLQPP